MIIARANAWYFNARNTVDYMTKNSLERLKLTQARTAINKAIYLQPIHPHYLHMSAFISVLEYEYDAVHSIDNNEESFQIIEAKKALNLSLAHRKSWSKTWVLLAQVVSIEQGASKQVYSLLKNAKLAGPYDFDVHLAVLHISLNNWENLSPNFRHFYVQELINAANQDFYFHKVFDMAEEIGMLSTLCLSLQFGKEFDKVKQTSSYKYMCVDKRLSS